MRLHYLQHVWFEDLGVIKNWAKDNGFLITRTKLFENEALPNLESFDFLVVLGGPMGVYDQEKYPWLREEKLFIDKAIKGGKYVLGICLGAQLISLALGNRVYKNQYKEIGWFQLNRVDAGFNKEIFPRNFTAFHWHADTYDLSKNETLVASSQACLNQAFLYDNARVVGLQFHLEVTNDSVKRLIDNCSYELTEGKFIQEKEEMLGRDKYLNQANLIMNNLLDYMIKDELSQGGKS